MLAAICWPRGPDHSCQAQPPCYGVRRPAAPTGKLPVEGIYKDRLFSHHSTSFLTHPLIPTSSHTRSTTVFYNTPFLQTNPLIQIFAFLQNHPNIKMQYSKIFSVVALLVASAAAAPLCAPNAPNTPTVPHVPGGDHGSDGVPTPSHDLEGKTCSNTQYSNMACNIDGKFSFVSGIG